ncbi:MAG TPA: formylglycine-generating enzyme family protein, partial [Anaerolineales bacterium]|nr:formylglycine-generating enzyme family protein [Anaerolineales bacterium]
KDSIAKDIRAALKFVMQDADPDTGKPNEPARIPIESRASAADTLDELGYIPDDLYGFAEFRSTDRSTDLSRYYMARHPVTNLQYQRFLDAPDFADEKYWVDFPKYDQNGERMEQTWGRAGFEFLQRNLKDTDDSDGKVLFPRYWLDPRFGIARRTAPVVGISWYEANAYCKWLTHNWQSQPEAEFLSSFTSPMLFRLPTEPEWIRAAGGLGEPLVTGKNKDGKEITRHRFPWDEAGRVTPEPTSRDDEIMKEILRRTNTYESGINRTTPAGMYPLGRVNGLWDMSGNVWEWQVNYASKDKSYLGLRGGSWNLSRDFARVSVRVNNHPNLRGNYIGFRVVAVSLPNG